MRNFIVIWLGQTVSLIGSQMTNFAITIWVWELTGQATALALFGLLTQAPRVLVTPFAGIIVDRCNRKLLMMIGDAIACFSTIVILLLYLTNNLQIWHLYLAGAINGIFEQLQELAYLASISMMVSEEQYSRASSIGFLASYGSDIIAPALAGVLYAVIGLIGILIIDLATFAIALLTLLFVRIPEPAHVEPEPFSRANLQQQVVFGCRYIMARPSLLALLVLEMLFWFAHDLGAPLYSPMILARTGNDAKVLASLASAAGIGGVLGALLVSAWGGTKRRIHGMLIGIIGAGLSKTAFGLGQMLLIWIPAQFCSSLNFPLLGSSSDAIWLTQIKPDVQGRVFAARRVSILVASTIGYLIAGPLADYVFEPAMIPGNSLATIFGGIFGTGKGAGMTLLYVISSLGLLLVGLSGYAFRVLREIDVESGLSK
jgi:MFS family permease